MTETTCLRCHKRPSLCFCPDVQPLGTRLKILILQHPQEPDKDLGTARLAHLALKKSVLTVGLSWPNLAKAFGHPAEQSKWAALYLGGLKEVPMEPDERLKIVSKSKQFYEPGEVPIEGIIAIDGTWAQAKTIWWRNPWLSKLKRIVLNPASPSLYSDLRKEPRKECLSTIEALAETLDVFGEKQAVVSALRAHFAGLLSRYRSIDPKINQG